MKKSLLLKVLFLSVVIILMLSLCSCGMLFDSIFNNDEYNDNLTNNGNNHYDNMPDSDSVTITTTANDTDDYGLAGSYTMLNSKSCSVGEAVELTATVNDGYNFEGWYVVEKSGSGYYEQTNLVLLSNQTNFTYTMQNKSVTISAIFSSYTITTASSTNTGGAAGSFTRLNNKKVSDGETIKLTATVNDGYNFEGWYIGNVCVSRNPTYNYTMKKENVNIEAKYSCYTLSTIGYAKDANGKTEAGFNAGTYTKYSNENLSVGKTVKLKATVNDGYNFMGWYVNGNCVSTNKEFTYTMGKENVQITALYSYYTITTSTLYKMSGIHYNLKNPAYYISPVYNDQKISVGTNVTLIAKEVEGYTFDSWINDNHILVSHDMEYSFTMQESNRELYALYILK